MAIKATGNEWFDKLYQRWVEITQNTSAKHEALKAFEKYTRKGSEADRERTCNEIIISIEKKEQARKKLVEERRFVAEWPSLAVYIRQRRFLDDEIGDKPKAEKRTIYCQNHADQESVYAIPPFLCAECIAEQTMKTDPIVEMMRKYSRDNNLGKLSQKEMRVLCKRNINKFKEKANGTL